MVRATLSNEDNYIIDGVKISDLVFEHSDSTLVNTYRLENIEDIIDHLECIIDTYSGKDYEETKDELKTLNDYLKLGYESIFANNDYTELVVPSSNNELYNRICDEYINDHEKVINEKHIFLIEDIDWDIDEEDRENVILPTRIIISVSLGLSDDEMEEYISDTITNMYGFCHNGFSIDGNIPQG